MKPAEKVTFEAVKAADDRYQAELYRQFGCRAGDARYTPDAHDERTAAARCEFHRLSTIYTDALTLSRRQQAQ